MHYNNPLGYTGVIDTSGVELTLTPSLRTHDAAVIASGIPPSEVMRIPPGQGRFTMQVDARLALTAPARAFTYALHAHQIGVRLEAWLIRDGVVVSSLGVEDPYSFDLQVWTVTVAAIVI